MTKSEESFRKCVDAVFDAKTEPEFLFVSRELLLSMRGVIERKQANVRHEYAELSLCLSKSVYECDKLTRDNYTRRR